MTSAELIKKLESIARKVERMKEENTILKRKNDTLQKELIDLRQKLDLKKTEQENIENQLKMVKLAKFLNKGDVQNTKLQINQLIKDINTSINLLTQPNGAKSEQDSNKA